ncbi:MAG: hypothetical protein ACI30V_05395 [Muribaculaceae bacterium]
MKIIFEKLSTEEAFETVLSASLWINLYLFSAGAFPFATLFDESFTLTPMIVVSFILEALFLLSSFLRLNALNWSLKKLFAPNLKSNIGWFTAIEAAILFVVMFLEFNENDLVQSAVQHASAIMLVIGLVIRSIARAKE